MNRSTITLFHFGEHGTTFIGTQGVHCFDASRIKLYGVDTKLRTEVKTPLLCKAPLSGTGIIEIHPPVCFVCEGSITFYKTYKNMYNRISEPQL